MASQDSNQVPVNEIKRALDKFSNPRLNQAERRRIEDDLARIKQNVTMCFLCGEALIQENNQQYAMFGYHCLHHLCSKSWQILTDEQKNQLKSFGLKLYSKHVTNMLTTRGFVKEQIVKMVVAIALRTWPMTWTDMPQVLFKEAKANPASHEMLLLIFKDLFSACGQDYLGLSEKDKRKIKDSLMKISTDITQFFAYSLHLGINYLYENKNSTNTQQQMAILILKRVLDALPTFLNQWSLDLILQANIIDLIARIIFENRFELTMSKHGLYDQSLQCLDMFYLRKFSQLNSMQQV